MPKSGPNYAANCFRQTAPHRDDVLVVATDSTGVVLLQQDPSGLHLPRFRAEAERPLWRAALQGVSRVVGDPELIGWGGASSTLTDQVPVLRVLGREIVAGNDAGFVGVDRSDAVKLLADDPDRAIAEAAFGIDPE